MVASERVVEETSRENGQKIIVEKDERKHKGGGKRQKQDASDNNMCGSPDRKCACNQPFY